LFSLLTAEPAAGGESAGLGYRLKRLLQLHIRQAGNNRTKQLTAFFTFVYLCLPIWGLFYQIIAHDGD
jgi:hypothetical protein